jgi:hypothetical protein
MSRGEKGQFILSAQEDTLATKHRRCNAKFSTNQILLRKTMHPNPLSHAVISDITLLHPVGKH